MYAAVAIFGLGRQNELVAKNLLPSSGGDIT